MSILFVNQPTTAMSVMMKWWRHTETERDRETRMKFAPNERPMNERTFIRWPGKCENWKIELSELRLKRVVASNEWLIDRCWI